MVFTARKPDKSLIVKKKRTIYTHGHPVAAEKMLPLRIQIWVLFITLRQTNLSGKAFTLKTFPIHEAAKNCYPDHQSGFAGS